MSTDASHAKPGKFTAMISSTALDLPDHRAAVREACLGAGIFPIAMEHLPARDASGVAVSLEMVDKADIYIGIYAFRYGWKPHGSTISITEKEYDYAVARQKGGMLKELLIFTAHADHSFTAKAIEADKTAQRKLAAFKARAGSGRVRKEFKSVGELRHLVSEALNEFKHRLHASSKGQPPSPTPQGPVPNNLPRIPFFFGRDKELEKIADALKLEKEQIWGALIRGTGGVGKTSLAIRAAQCVTIDQFDRILFLSAKDRKLTSAGEKALSGFVLPGYLQMINEIAERLSRKDLLKCPAPKRARAVIEALRDRRVLLVLDNLETLADQDQPCPRSERSEG